MPIPDWDNFSKEAKKQLTQELEAGYHQSFIRFLYEPSFAPHTYIQFVWNENSVQWSYAQWHQNKDHDLLANPLTQLQFLTKPAVPYITLNTGQVSTTTLVPVITLLRSLQVQPVVTPAGITIDGAHYTISIGVGDAMSVYTWHTLPNGWEQLETLAGLLIKTIDQLCKPTLL